MGGISVAVQVVVYPVAIDVHGEMNMGGQRRILSVGWCRKGTAATIQADKTFEIQTPAEALAGGVRIKVQPLWANVRVDFASMAIRGFATRVRLITENTGLRPADRMGWEERDANRRLYDRGLTVDG